jgi:hypothetical protein
MQPVLVLALSVWFILQTAFTNSLQYFNHVSYTGFSYTLGQCVNLLPSAYAKLDKAIKQVTTDAELKKTLAKLATSEKLREVRIEIFRSDGVTYEYLSGGSLFGSNLLNRSTNTASRKGITQGLTTEHLSCILSDTLVVVDSMYFFMERKDLKRIFLKTDSRTLILEPSPEHRFQTVFLLTDHQFTSREKGRFIPISVSFEDNQGNIREQGNNKLMLYAFTIKEKSEFASLSKRWYGNNNQEATSLNQQLAFIANVRGSNGCQNLPPYQGLARASLLRFLRRTQ